MCVSLPFNRGWTGLELISAATAMYSTHIPPTPDHPTNACVLETPAGQTFFSKCYSRPTRFATLYHGLWTILNCCFSDTLTKSSRVKMCLFSE